MIKNIEGKINNIEVYLVYFLFNPAAYKNFKYVQKTNVSL